MFDLNFQPFSYLGSAASTLMSASGRCFETASWLGEQIVELPETMTAGCKTFANTAVRCCKVAHALYKTPYAQYPKYLAQSGHALWSLLRDRNYQDMTEYVLARIPEIAGGVRQGLIGVDWCAEKVLGASLIPLNLLNASDATACISGAGRLGFSVLDRAHNLTAFEKLGVINSVAVAIVSGTRFFIYSDQICTPEEELLWNSLWYLEVGVSALINVPYYTWVTYNHQERFRNWADNIVKETRQLLDIFHFPGQMEAEALA